MPIKKLWYMCISDYNRNSFYSKKTEELNSNSTFLKICNHILIIPLECGIFKGSATE